jgi:hypothetical protein
MREQDRRHIEKTGPKELAWFAGLWAVGVAAVIVLGLFIKLFI